MIFGDPGTEAFKFSEGGGFESLGFLPGDVVSVIRGISRDGLVLGGSSWTGPQGSRNFSSHAVVWDPHGIRDIAGELSAAGIDFTDIALSDVTNAWSGSPLVVLGSGSIGKSQIAWVATLPERP